MARTCGRKSWNGLRRQLRHAISVLALGSTLSVYPAANIPLLAAARGVPYVINNRGPTEHDQIADVTLRLEGDVGEWLPPAVDEALVLVRNPEFEA